LPPKPRDRAQPTGHRKIQQNLSGIGKKATANANRAKGCTTNGTTHDNQCERGNLAGLKCSGVFNCCGFGDFLEHG
jgi:hypothetical protein